jgi:acetolactate synthase-1/2/3 large subunit
MHKHADAAGLNTIARPASHRWVQLPHRVANPEKEVLCYYGDGAFSMTAYDMETANPFKLPYIAVVGNNNAMNQIRYGQLAKYGQERGNVGDLLSDLPFGKLAEMVGGYGEEVHDPALIPGALQ